MSENDRFPSRVEIDLDALANNMRRVKALAGQGVSVMAVVKANAYGHGAPQVAEVALRHGADMLAVANFAEALQLRESGINAPILILGYVPPEQIRQARDMELRLTVYDPALAAQYLSALDDDPSSLRVHLKVDTGMHRLGVLPQDALAVARELRDSPLVELEGVYTHFAAADEDPAYTAAQLAIFRRSLGAMRAEGIAPRFAHAANSPALLDCRDSYFNLARPGVILYGLKPMPDSPGMEGFRPAMRWTTRVAQVKTVPPGSRVGYGYAYTTSREETLAMLPVGYADGIRRAPRPWREVLIHGKRAPLVGRVSMEKIIVDVSDIPGIRIGDAAVLLGRQGEDEILAGEIAQWLGTNNYEVVCSAAPRVPRFYTRSGLG